MAQQQARDDDRDHPGGVDLLGRQVGRERHDERDAGVELRVGDPLAHPGDQREDGGADEDAAGGGHRSRDRPPRHSAPPSRARSPRSPCAGPPRAVASLRSDSPSRIVTTRRGSPIRRPIAVAATASGGATTAPIANEAAHEMPGRSSCTRAPMPTVVKATSPIDSRRMGRRLALKSTSEALDRGRVQQRRQHAEQHDLGLEVDLGYAGEERRHHADRDQHQRCGHVQPPGQRGEGQHCDGHGDEQQGDFHAPMVPDARGGCGRTGGAGRLRTPPSVPPLTCPPPPPPR